LPVGATFQGSAASRNAEKKNSPPASRLAKSIGISPNRIAEIVNNRGRITPETALRLGLYFGNSPEFLDESWRATTT
jgi:plasmid maintenance system antidote protein VapI